MNNKGSVLDILYIGVCLFVFAIFLVISQMIINAWSSGTTDQGFVAEATSIIASGNVAMTAFDYGFVAITMGMIIGTVILAFYVGFHPVFFFLGILEAAVVLLLVPQFSNIYYNIAHSTSTEMTTAAGTFTITGTIMNSLPYVLAGAAFLVIIVMYSRWRQGGISA